jgi:hypothetical protein
MDHVSNPGIVNPGIVKPDAQGDPHEIVDRRRTDAPPASVLDIISDDVVGAMKESSWSGRAGALQGRSSRALS